GRGPSDASFGVTSPVVVTVVAAHVVRDGGGDPFGGLGIGASGFQGDESVDGDTPVGHVTDRSGKSAVDEFSGQPLGGGGRSPRMSGFGGHGGGGGGGRRRRHRPGRARKVFGGYRSRGVLRDEPTVRGSPRARHGGCAHRPWVRPHVQTMTVGGLVLAPWAIRLAAGCAAHGCRSAPDSHRSSPYSAICIYVFFTNKTRLCYLNPSHMTMARGKAKP